MALTSGMTDEKKLNITSPRCAILRNPDQSQTEDEEEVGEENGVLFYVNKSGFPLNDKTWERMWHHVAKIHPDGNKMVTEIRNSKELPRVPLPVVPVFPTNTAITDRLWIVQKYMSDLQYNHTGTQFFEIRKNRPLTGLIDSAKEIIREALPIKCLEAVILAIHLTNGMPGVERFPVSFKSQFGSTVHRHVVLGVYCGGRYGALGMSRREDLMYKPLEFKCLSDLVIDYEESYKRYLHVLKKVKIGYPVSHDPHSYECIYWKALTLNMTKLSQDGVRKEVEKYSREVRAKMKTSGLVSERPPLVPPPSSPRKDTPGRLN
ncbi:VASH1 [Branchiostoma lanceolatum]|uniref:VASH1 protein n=2 Tax=Branchiostoma lanceolatum TaxID=7740 RepID=A0A8K0EQN8_BRALA|nr:VASH1 [Branchiostoma lanceolatum]